MTISVRHLRRLTFDGHLSVSASDRAAATADFGRMRDERPLAVLRPASVADVARVVKYARAADAGVAARGRGHSTYGQAQCAGGIVVDMSSLEAVSMIGSRTLDAEGGATWKQVLDASVAHGAMPPVLPDFLGLSVGGLISLGGIGYQTCRYGTVADHVRSLSVVTGTGDIVECSRRVHADLFRAVRGGLGQFGIIVRARLALRAAPPLIRFTRYLYTALAPLLADLRRLATMQRGRFDTICAFDLPNEQPVLRDIMGDAAKGLWFGPWVTRRLFVLQVGRYTRSAAPREGASEEDPPRCVPGVRHMWVDRFGDFADRASVHLVHWKRTGLWQAPHPWFNVLVPGASADRWLPAVIDGLDPSHPADGPIMIYPVVRRRSIPSMLQMPPSAYALRVDVLRSAMDADAHRLAEVMRANRRLYATCVARGGVQYPSAALDMRAADWRRHFGAAWKVFESARQRYDPDALLAPGQGIVTSRSNPASPARASARRRRQTPRSVSR
jgi:FAD/FMN-containing dehydrogenase